MQPLSLEAVVEQYYAMLYRFAWALTRHESNAADLTQQTFLIWSTKGHQLLDSAKVKTWLFTTLHRQFLEGQRRASRFPHLDIEEAALELPTIDPGVMERIDTATLLEALSELDPLFRAPVALFYLKEHSYREIAEVLEVPLGTVKSRLARGIVQLQSRLMGPSKAIAPARKGFV